jgi:hypothetical protein
MSQPIRCAITASLLALSACSDYATFVTSTSIGIKADANTEQAHIGYARAELFQGPAYPDVGDVPQVVGFLGSNLKIFEPHIRQLYATGDAAGLVTTLNDLQPCPKDGKAPADGQPTMCAEKPESLTGERRPMVFGTGASVGLNVGFTANAPSSIKFGYDREELSIIPFHKQAPGSDKPDKYGSVLASIGLNVAVPSILGTELQLTQFFATGAAARNLAKNPDIRAYFKAAATTAVVDETAVAAAGAQLTQDQKDIDTYFGATSGTGFTTLRDKLLKDSDLKNIAGAMPDALKSAKDRTTFDNALLTKPGLTPPIARVARRLTAAG